MAILIDPPAWPAHGTLWSHLVSDRDTDELHAFAARVPLPRRSFDLDHYDIPAALHERAVELGARAVAGRDIVLALRDSGLRVAPSKRALVAPIHRRKYLDAEWAALGVRLGTASTAEGASRWQHLGETLIARYNESHRSYHDERHLEDVLLSLDQLATRGERVPDETLAAAWFHDAVYRGVVGADEADSAKLAVDSLANVGLDASVTDRVGRFIVSTDPSHSTADPERPLAHLLDADLAIFGASPKRYGQYSRAVRGEYAHIADDAFALGRARILRGYLDRPEIYRTPAARELWEARARANVGAEVERLRSTIPNIGPPA